MEPRSFNRGDTELKYGADLTSLLQWSHGRLTVVTRMLPEGERSNLLLQWSHGRLTVVTHRMDSSIASPVLASMEPRSFNRGDGPPARRYLCNDVASMEPRSFNRGDGPPARRYLAMTSLQWSHGRLTVVTRYRSFMRPGCLSLQWSHGRLTVVTSHSEPYHRLRLSRFNGATVV